MEQVRLRVNSQVCGWKPGDVVQVVRSRMVEGLIRNEYVTVLDEPAASAAPQYQLPDRIKVPPELLDQLATPLHRPSLDPEGTRARAELSVDVVAVPPRTGRGSGADKWRAFLDTQRIDHAHIKLEDRAALIGLWDEKAGR